MVTLYKGTLVYLRQQQYYRHPSLIATSKLITQVLWHVIYHVILIPVTLHVAPQGPPPPSCFHISSLIMIPMYV